MTTQYRTSIIIDTNSQGGIRVKDLNCDKFQDIVSECLIRHKSIIDVITKFQESAARVNRAIAKSVTYCGCIKIQAEKQKFPTKIELKKLSSYMNSHLNGELCQECYEILEQELGNHIFYIAALCNLLGVKMEDVLAKENDKLTTLGVYNLS